MFADNRRLNRRLERDARDWEEVRVRRLSVQGVGPRLEIKCGAASKFQLRGSHSLAFTITMLRLRPVFHCRSLSRRYATAASPHALVFLEHREGVIDSGSLSALTAAHQLGGQVTGLVIGAPDQVNGVVENAKK